MSLELLYGWSQHISTIIFITGILHLALVGVRKAQLPDEHVVKKYGEPIASIALFPVGILQFISFFVYLINIIFGIRGPAALPPEWAQWTIPFTVLQGGSMIVGSASAIGQAGRKVPWSVLTGGGIGVIGAGAVWSSVAPVLTAYPTMALAAGIGIILFVSMFYISLPAQEVIKTSGDAFAFSPLTIANGALMTVLGLISGIGVVVL